MWAEMQDMTSQLYHPDKCCENPDDHRPFTLITFQLMMTKDIDDDDNYEIEEEKSEEASVAVVHCCTRLSTDKNINQNITPFCKRLPSHTGEEQACTRITWLVVCLFVTMPKMAQCTGKWFLTAPY